MSDENSVQRELGSIGAKLDGLTGEIRYRFDTLSGEIDKVKADADHDIRNVKAALSGLEAKVDRKVIEQSQWDAHLEAHDGLADDLDSLKGWRGWMTGALAVLGGIMTIGGAALANWIGNIPHH